MNSLGYQRKIFVYQLYIEENDINSFYIIFRNQVDVLNCVSLSSEFPNFNKTVSINWTQWTTLNLLL